MASLSQADRLAGVRAIPARRRSLAVPVGVLFAATLIAVLVKPMVVDRTFIGFDWYTHLWYIWHAEGALREHGLPSLYAHNTAGVFDPHFAFYGGTLYALAGAVSLLAGSPERGFVLSWALGFAGAYGGLFWLARQAGLNRWVAHAPGILFVTAPYYLATIYAGSSWAEFMAVSTIPMLLASGLSVLRADRLRPLPSLALAVSCVLFLGSHNLTMVWGSTILLVVGGAIFVLVPDVRRLVTRAGLLRVAVIAVPAFLVDAWFLLPDVVYQSHTVVARNAGLAENYLRTSMYLVKPSQVLSLGRASGDPTIPHYSLQLPLLAAGWVVVGLVVVRSGWRTSWFRSILIVLVAMVGLVVLMTQLSLLLALPGPYSLLQLSYRLEAYIQLGVAVAVIATLALVTNAVGRRRLWAWAVVPVLIVSIVQGWSQVNQPPSRLTRLPPWSAKAAYHTTGATPAAGDYTDGTLQGIDVNPNLPTVRLSPSTIERDGRAELTIDAFPGQVVQTNIVAAPDLIHVTGAHFFSRDGFGTGTLSIDEDNTPGAARITVQAAHPWPVILGRVLSLLGLAGLVGVAVAIVRGGGARRAKGRARPVR